MRPIRNGEGGTVRVGCSGWQYRHWAPSARTSTGPEPFFYPHGLPQSRWFEHYAQVFDTVEINNSFYRLPPPDTFASWAARAPDGFLFAVKASRFLTHMKKLTDPEEPLRRFSESARRLGPHLGPILFQLPPHWPVNVDRFEIFLHTLKDVTRRLRIRSGPVVEFRDPTRYDDRILTLMEQHGVSLCLHDMQGSATGRMTVGPLVYVRFHGWTKYAGRYADERLDEWAGWLAERSAAGVDVFAYFNNDVGGHAPRDAVRLRERIRGRLDDATEVASRRARSTRRSLKVTIPANGHRAPRARAGDR
jgi:uncharacterized protein YecE (DUF72 family)